MSKGKMPLNLREMYAGIAMQAIVANEGPALLEDVKRAEKVARAAWVVADYMVRESIIQAGEDAKYAGGAS